MNTTIKWVTIPHWLTAGFVGLSRANGLIRFRLKGETMFLGHAAKGGLGARIGAYRRGKGTGQNYHAARMIHQHRTEVEVQIAVMDKPADEILRLFNTKLKERVPEWNVPNGHWRVAKI